MSGWKTWAGAAIVAVSAVLGYVGFPDLATMALTIGGALGLVGVAHKIEKNVS